VHAVSPAESAADVRRLIPLQVGALTAPQIALLLTHLPVDVTFVDEHDEVRFYSATKERIFDRQPAIIGRKVQQCHPPASIHRVQRILDDFSNRRRDTAEFWIQSGGPESQGGKFLHIRYFALRDEQGNYRGTLEVTQDVTAIRNLEGRTTPAGGRGLGYTPLLATITEGAAGWPSAGRPATARPAVRGPDGRSTFLQRQACPCGSKMTSMWQSAQSKRSW